MMTQPAERAEPVCGREVYQHTACTTPPVNAFHLEDWEQFTLDNTCTHQDASLVEMSANRLSSAGPENNGDV